MADVTHWKGNRSPSLFATIKTDENPFDLTGSTVKFKMRPDGDVTLKVNAAATPIVASTTLSAGVTLPTPTLTVGSTTGFLPSGSLLVGGQIVSYKATSANAFLGCSGGSGAIAPASAVAQIGGVRYDWAAADVDTPGEFVGWWEVTLPSTFTQDSPEFEIAMLDHAPVSRGGLCELEDVTAYAPGYRDDPKTNAALLQFILAESHAIMRMTGREFRPIVPALNVRKFDLGEWECTAREVMIGDLAADPTLVRLLNWDQTSVVQTVSAPAWVSMPRNRQEWEPVTSLAFPLYASNAIYPLAGQVLEVTAAAWGFPQVPPDIREACARLTLFRYINDAASTGTQFAEALATADVNLGALFASSREVIGQYAPLVGVA